MRLPLTLLVVVLAAVAGFWWRLGQPVPIATTLAPGGKLECVSYSPFRGEQNPLDLTVMVEPWQIEEDLSRLAAVTKCIRTYSIQHGLDQIPAIAARHGLKVLQGLWLSSQRDKNRIEIDRTIALANRYPGTITGVVVGNEVLLRGELSADDLGAVIRTVKAAVPVPVTYADVWEFWLRNRDLAAAVDFITVHILPYWEDIPIPAETAGAHVESIVGRVKGVFPGRDILVGEVGWPSAGRMREGALPSLSNEALVVQDVLERAARSGFRVNLIEAFDQPWKRRLEGTVGGHWGMLSDGDRTPKFAIGEPVSDHPAWARNAGLGAALVLLVFGAAYAGAGPGRDKVPATSWIAVALTALVAGALFGWGLDKILVESLGRGGWIRGGLLALAAAGTPVAAAVLLVRGERLPAFARVLGGPGERPADPVAMAAGLLFVLTAVLAVQTALGLVFDPRYRDFPFASLTAATVPLVLVALVRRPGPGERGLAEIWTAAALLLSALFVVFNETVANWQAVWLAGVFAALAVTLSRVRAEPG